MYPEDKYLYRFKPCVVESCTLNFAPNQPAFFNQTAAPAEVVMTLNLLEIEYFVQEDIIATWNKSSVPGGDTVVEVPTGTSQAQPTNP